MSATSNPCLYSTVRNTSGVTKRFMGLPPHGRTLEDGEEYSIWGDLLEAIFLHGRDAGQRFAASFEALLDSGDLTIVKTPSPILFDDTDDLTQILKLDNGVLYAADPCWTSSPSSLAL